ncbi:hypothetical protein COCC4DRAFT_59107 [Bipolaris maydis ATCC 48331]|uniref:Uncharacterized protein n=2 Tax=Cochliobolus heterostrophus TaxID=5016 RepID=M2T6P5_COCH5|nr:uncharacterized protein COCC4DRAFT_59107 [Bipolaris maydis ATCC 48331]EMD93265.1 hypothetical protein COCHEDRAFT_1095075 [Bipolaris maydis C5]ENI07287.1 hypothetical protein COCC4DRAFT_59107 [Bipolaris maydis ATCC 48331]
MISALPIPDLGCATGEPRYVNGLGGSGEDGRPVQWDPTRGPLVPARGDSTPNGNIQVGNGAAIGSSSSSSSSSLCCACDDKYSQSALLHVSL